MNSITTHVCLVSDQPAPNLLPLLDESLKPQRVVLLVTPQMKDKATYLERVIAPMGIKVETIALDAAENFDDIQDKLLNLLTQEQSANIALNATGGTKWMVIAAQDVFRVNGSPVFYVSIENDTLLFLGAQQKPRKLQQLINLETFLKSYGYSVIGDSKPQGLPSEQKELCQQLVLKVSEWGGALGQLNYLAALAGERSNLRIPVSELKQDNDSHLKALLAEFQAAGLLQESDKGIVHFSDASSRAFANGGWLEAYVNSLLNKLKVDGLLQDSARINLRVKNASNTSNEIDVAFMANNHFHIIECKTKRFVGNQAGTALTESLYKLDSISTLGGLGTRSMLVSYRELGKADRIRASDLRIKVIEASAIQNLQSHLKQWIQRPVIDSK